MSSKKNGQIITFYSFKGGTGRSMTLANLACLLAGRCQPDKGVLMVDWDLEAPGLHRYFYKHLSQKSEAEAEKVLEDSQGLIELFCEIDTFLTSESSEVSAISETETSKVLSLLALEKYVLKTNIPSLSLLKAGSFDEAYSTRVNTFDWEKLHGKAPGLFRAFAQLLSEQYEYVLIDSRTGLTDTSGICTMLLPEKLVVVFTPNRQSLTGVRNLMETSADYRKQSEDLRPLLMFPLVSRLEPTENTLRQYWRYGNGNLGITGYQGQFENCFKEIYGIQSCSLETYFNEVLVQHVPSLSYGEEIAVLGQGSSDGLVLKRRYENLLEYLLRPSPPWVSKELLDRVAKSEERMEGIVEEDLQSICPYPGLKPFEENDQKVFFGRESVIERLLKSLRLAPRFLALLGPSGSGKSSLINAGVIPHLRKGDLPASEQWKIVVCRLGRDPFESLKAHGLLEAEDDLSVAVTNLLNAPMHSRLLLVIDQFEELFTIVEYIMRERFIEQMIKLLSSDVPCVVLVSMRTDFYGQLVTDVPELLSWLEKGTIALSSNLSREELRDIVAKPAQVSGVSFEEGLVENDSKRCQERVQQVVVFCHCFSSP